MTDYEVSKATRTMAIDGKHIELPGPIRALEQLAPDFSGAQKFWITFEVVVSSEDSFTIDDWEANSAAPAVVANPNRRQVNHLDEILQMRADDDGFASPLDS